MASKYRATVGISQEKMNKLADKFPEINDITKFENFSAIVQYLFEKIISGDLIEKSMSTKDDLDDKIKKQNLLKLTLQNWNLLKEFPSDFEQKIAIIMLEKDMVEPQLEFHPKPASLPEGLTQLSYCHSCNHYHYGDTPRKCKTSNCPCGVRG